jgi:hypothetical protein
MLLIATPGDATANSYGTLEEAEDYFLTHLQYETWNAIVDPDAALIHATRILDQLDYIGDVATETQSLKWPRIENDLYDVLFDDDEIPLRMKYAQFETAIFLVGTGAAAVAAGTVSELQIGSSVKVKYAGSSATIDLTVDNWGLPVSAARYLKGLRIVNLLA